MLYVDTIIEIKVVWSVREGKVKLTLKFQNLINNFLLKIIIKHN